MLPFAHVTKRCATRQFLFRRTLCTEPQAGARSDMATIRQIKFVRVAIPFGTGTGWLISANRQANERDETLARECILNIAMATISPVQGPSPPKNQSARVY